MAHPKQTLKRRRYVELRTVPAEAARQRLMELSKNGVGRKAVVEFTGLDHRGIAKIKNGQTKYVRRITEETIFSVPFNAHCDRALIDASETWRLIKKAQREGFTKSEIARRLSPNKKAKYKPGWASLQFGEKRVTALTAMKVERFIRLLDAEAA